MLPIVSRSSLRFSDSASLMASHSSSPMRWTVSALTRSLWGRYPGAVAVAVSGACWATPPGSSPANHRPGRGEPPAGPVVLFSVEAAEPGAFWANFTFTQGHTAFHANANDPRQMGLIDGSLGPLAVGDAVLGYVVLPADVDVAQPMDVYWNDRRLVATLHR